MRLHSLFASWLYLIAATGCCRAEQNESYPTRFRDAGFNSTEHRLSLGTTPLVPLADIQASDQSRTPPEDECPKRCSTVGPDPANWTQIYDREHLLRCKEPALFDLNVHNTPSRYTTIRSRVVTLGRAGAKRATSIISNRNNKANVKNINSTNLDAAVTPLTTSNSCGAYKSTVKVAFTAGPAVLAAGDDAASAADLLASYLESGASCGTTILFAKSGAAIVGLSRVDIHGVRMLGSYIDLAVLIGVQGDHSTVPEKSRRNLHDSRSLEIRADCRAIQVVPGDSCASLSVRCGIRGRDFIKYNFRFWLCASLMPKEWVCCSAGALPDMRPKSQPDGTCATHIVAAGDGCWAIADNHGITQDDIDDFNKNTWGWAGCAGLQVGQIICLSCGSTPMPAPIDGVTCGPQVPGTMKPSGSFDGRDLVGLNQCPLRACCSGWGYCGTTSEFCTRSPADTGSPGAFKPGTNGCISNCGTHIVGNELEPPNFARVGYFQGYSGARDCLRMDASEILDSLQGLTHVHFAFAGLTEDFNVHISENIRDQFFKFVNLRAVPFKKIVSFGGWAESTEPATYQHYRDALKPINQNRFARNVMKFLDEHRLDGVDFDWEYPGATDIPGIPAGTRRDALNYMRFLSVMRSFLDPLGSRTLSIALPASYWYLKAFPVHRITQDVDYFIYMTYDLHGQWDPAHTDSTADYGNKFSNPGCPTGNCLRSHINRTETYNALVMITKAGVPAHKIFAGVTSYGRRFRMLDPGCVGPLCTFTGSYGVSEAEPGQCTGTGGYIANAELREIFNYAERGVEGFEAKKWYDTETESDIMTWFVSSLFLLARVANSSGRTRWAVVHLLCPQLNSMLRTGLTRINLDGTRGQGMTDWVAYMDGDTKSDRIEWIRGLNFGGVSDWAIDLSGWFHGPDTKGGWSVTTDELQCDSSSWPGTLEGLDANLGTIPVQCRGVALLRILAIQLEDAIKEYNTFGWYADWVKDAINARLDDFLAIHTGEGLKYMDCKWETAKDSGEGPCTTATLKYDLGLDPGPRVVEFTMRDEEGFYKALLEKTGIKKEWVRWTDDAVMDPCIICGPQLTCPEQATCGQNYYMRKNFPRRVLDKDKIDVVNPKKIVNEAIPNLGELANLALATYLEMRWGTIDADPSDIGTAFSMPLFMLQDASKSIAEIKDIGEEHQKTKTRDLVLMILSIVFSVIPFATVATQALGGAARIAAAGLIIGEAGNTAISIAEIIENPASAPFLIVGMLVGAGGIRVRGARVAFKDAANARRAIGVNDLKFFSPEFRRKDKLVQTILKNCVR
ncbi:Chitinase [Tolypocladium paradoxum]|uniref:chitinase n=1 Tax=Tolypocladium paradoxum TaxID=94208 RepID=A0A2S4L7D5_9HYPO|nr:Chitinase [Tolypocladium paradoxum]